MMLRDWLAKQVTDDPRALRWLDEPGCEDRIARAYQELLAGYQIEPGTLLKTTRMLEPGEAPGRVEVREIAFYSLCAHHFLPFFGEVDVVYEPGDRILGLGKLPRLVDALARRFQIQEDLVPRSGGGDDRARPRAWSAGDGPGAAHVYVQPRAGEPDLHHPHRVRAWDAGRRLRVCSWPGPPPSAPRSPPCSWRGTESRWRRWTPPRSTPRPRPAT